jgi:hypothetical protein
MVSLRSKLFFTLLSKGTEGCLFFAYCPSNVDDTEDYHTEDYQPWIVTDFEHGERCSPRINSSYPIQNLAGTEYSEE